MSDGIQCSKCGYGFELSGGTADGKGGFIHGYCAETFQNHDSPIREMLAEMKAAREHYFRSVTSLDERIAALAWIVRENGAALK